MSKYFKYNFVWNKSIKSIRGLPRPYFDIPLEEQYVNGKFFLHPKVPIPWQSSPIFSNGRKLDIIKENEKQVFLLNLCPYCGNSFSPDESSIRWLAEDRLPEENGPRVLSDSYPFHIDCMKQGRIFCPHMRKTKDDEFEIGPYWQLRKNAVDYTIKIGILKPPTQ